MREYDTLVAEIRSLIRAFKATGNERCHLAIILGRAADAIEKLQKDGE